MGGLTVVIKRYSRKSPDWGGGGGSEGKETFCLMGTK
jgi:hypothetical protein